MPSATDAPVMLVTGGSGSIGAEVAAQVLRAGWRVIVQGRSDGSVTALLTKLDADDRVSGLVCDVAEADAVERLVAAAAARHGRLDAVVDCLVTGPREGGITGLFAATEPARFAAFAELSIVYLQRLAHAALPWLRQRGGTLVTFVSDAALFAAPHQAVIGAARAAAVGFVRNLAAEVAADGVRVHCISLSYVEGTRTVARLAAANASRLETARKRAGLGLPTPADIAPLVLFLCGDGARRMTGQVLSVNGGLNV